MVKPSKPQNVKAVSASASSVKVSWSKNANATGYQVWRSDSENGKYVALGSVNGTSRNCSGLTRGKTYYFKVRAYVEVDGERYYGDYSTVVSAIPKA